MACPELRSSFDQLMTNGKSKSSGRAAGISKPVVSSSNQAQGERNRYLPDISVAIKTGHLGGLPTPVRGTLDRVKSALG
jgi:hypothetical protein